ncbi:hypothetical protein KFK09_008021 [Dendrobium nobile]|uniref:Uncharacterized protein n=1 Tax=Dendrobium nobile TaxID=94219 RepID=A0A8T3BTF2_DENNO|nr:hypothetical protein KFK09_008021 [Dendrobium nobile]
MSDQSKVMFPSTDQVFAGHSLHFEAYFDGEKTLKGFPDEGIGVQCDWPDDVGEDKCSDRSRIFDDGEDESEEKIALSQYVNTGNWREMRRRKIRM